MKRKLFIFAWEYFGYHSLPGVALSRRITQVSNSFNKNGWDVYVIYKDQRNECGSQPFVVIKDQDNITRIPVKLSTNINPTNQAPLLRQITTFYYTLTKGDRTYEWIHDVIRHFPSFNIPKPDLILSFFTPRGPLSVGAYFAKKFNVPWIADLQDDLINGMSPRMHAASHQWAKKILSTAKAVVQVSPEWAAIETKVLGRPVDTIRHVVPDNRIAGLVSNPKPSNAPFTILYGGNINKQYQGLDVLLEIAERKNELNGPIQLVFAGHENVYKQLMNELNSKMDIVYHRWLDPKAYQQLILDCDCSLVLPWSKPPRLVIPSKFYEICLFNKPILIAGKDTGAFEILFKEWQHSPISFGEASFHIQAINNAIAGDYSKLFNLQNCKGPILYEKDLYNSYMSLL